MRKSISVSLLASVMAVGCSNPKEASKSNFSDAFDAYLKNGRVDSAKVCYRLYEFNPETNVAEIRELIGGRDVSDIIDQSIYREYAALGLFSVNKTVSEGRHFKSVIFAYTLTEKGKAFLVKGEHEDYVDGKVVPGYMLCAGQLTLDEVVSWTEPSSALGAHVSKVTYRVHYAGAS